MNVNFLVYEILNNRCKVNFFSDIRKKLQRHLQLRWKTSSILENSNYLQKSNIIWCLITTFSNNDALTFIFIKILCDSWINYCDKIFLKIEWLFFLWYLRKFCSATYNSGERCRPYCEILFNNKISINK